MTRPTGIPQSRKPYRDQIGSKRPVYNSSLRNFVPEYSEHWKRPVPESRKVWYLENNHCPKEWKRLPDDFLFVGEIVLLSPQADFIKNYGIDLRDGLIRTVHRKFNITKRYVLTGQSLDDLCGRMYSVAQTHVELNRHFDGVLLDHSWDHFVEQPRQKWFRSWWFDSMKAFGGHVNFDIVPNSRCFRCLKPVNELIDRCVVDFQITKNFRERTEIICSECDYEIRNPKPPKPDVSEAVKMRREAYRNGDKSIHWTVIGPREDWKCHICGEEVEQNSIPNNSRGATVEHLTPTSIGGEHQYENVRLAHKGCNSSKGNRRDDRKVNS